MLHVDDNLAIPLFPFSMKKTKLHLISWVKLRQVNFNKQPKGATTVCKAKFAMATPGTVIPISSREFCWHLQVEAQEPMSRVSMILSILSHPFTRLDSLS